MNRKKPKKTLPVSAEESALFREAVGTVIPVHNDKVSHPKKRVRSHHRQQLPQHHDYHGHGQDELNDHDKAHVSKSILRKFRHGQLPIDGRLDLHGKTQAQAKDAIKQFLQQADYIGVRGALIIIHGKGANSTDNLPVLKELTHYILSQHPLVTSYCHAAKQHGGSGATYVLLKHAS